MIRSALIALCLFLSPVISFAADPAAAPPQDPAIFDTKVAYTELMNYVQSTPSPDAAEVGTRADKVKTEADKVLATAGAAESSKQQVLAYTLIGYSIAVQVDATAYLSKFKNVASDCKARYPGSELAALGDAMFIQFDFSKLDAAAFTAKIKDFAKEYPKSNFGPQLVQAYCERLKEVDLDAAKKLVDDALVLYPSQADLTTYRESLNIVGRVAALSGKALDGKDFDIKNFAGKVVVIDFWATWCAPCKAMTPKMVKFYDDMKAKGVEIVGVSLDNGQDEVDTYVADHKIGWTQLFYPSSRKRQSVAKEYGVSGIPSLYVVGKDGKIASFPTHSFAAMERAVNAALAK
jgi:thiol-disulfide isomerase/thioredoxin